MSTEDEAKSSKVTCMACRTTEFKVFAIIWIIAGFAALIKSISCLAVQTNRQNVAGLVITIIFGPLYWVYYYAMGGCKK